ncbi:MAG: hypothetical protein LUD72_11945 [Bacteroidales bacterium]|nr:hypothetical protein [Bacteroidales bacterium]
MTQEQIRELFVDVYKDKIHREGSSEFLDYLLNKSDFFTAPASTRFHGAYAGGLCEHSLNVYKCLNAFLEQPRMKEQYGLEYSEETIAIVSMLHDVCKIDCYHPGTRNVKNEETGQWEKVPTYNYEDNLPYGHGEKSVYIISGYMRLTREEAMAIRWHMGFSGEDDKRNVGKALEMYPLAFGMMTADMEATYFLEGSED